VTDVTKNHPDNEYLEPDWAEGGAEYFEDLKKMYHESDIVVPLTYNDPGQHKTFVNGTVSRRSSWESQPILIAIPGSGGYLWVGELI
jgi:hypothetical protein